MTVNDHVVRYQEHVSTKSYEELVAAFEETVPDAGSASQPGRSSVCVTARTVVRRGKQPWRRCLGRAVSPACSPSIRVRSPAGTASRPRVPKLVGVPTTHQPTGRRRRCGSTGALGRRL